MKHVYCTFSGGPYERTTGLIVENAPKFGADEVWVYDDLWLTRTDFYRQNQWLWEHHPKRGFGWYCWKPYTILDALNRCDPGDIVLYTDADCFPVSDLMPLYRIAERDGIMLFNCNHNNRQWCKRDCFVVMACDHPFYHNAQHAVARFMLLEKGPWFNQQFLMEWLTYCINPRANTFDPSIYAPELDGFIEHRCEQAILTNLSHKYDIPLHREADQQGNWSDQGKDLYPQVFSHENDQPPEKSVCTALVEGSRYRNV